MRAAAIACAVALAGCGRPPGLSGEEGYAYFETPKLCEACPNLTRFARGGWHTVLVSSEYGCDFSVGSTGVVTGVVVEREVDDEWGYCSHRVHFATPMTGAFTLESGGRHRDRIRLSVAQPEELLIRRSDDRDWHERLQRIDPERLVVPLGAYIELAPVARDSLGVLALDESFVTFALAGDAITAERTYGEDPAEPRTGRISVGAVALGNGVVRAQYEGMTATLPIEVVPFDEIRPAQAWSGIDERCDSIDNDRDGSIDEAPHTLCRVENAVATCDAAGLCWFVSCQPGFGDCDDELGCETDILHHGAHCGACGNACDAGERCAEGACVPF